jgi:hypothetical protein
LTDALANLTKMRREKKQNQYNQKCKRGDNNKHQEITRDYLESLHSNKFENLEEMDRFLETYNHPKLNQEDIILYHKKNLKQQ